MHKESKKISRANASAYSAYYKIMSNGYNIRLFYTVNDKNGKLVAERLLKYKGTATKKLTFELSNKKFDY